MHQIRRYLVFLAENMGADIGMNLIDGRMSRPRKNAGSQGGDASVGAAPTRMDHGKSPGAGKDDRHAVGKAKHDGHLGLYANDGVGPLGNARAD